MRKSVVASAVVAIALGGAVVRYFVVPPQDSPGPSDVVVVLAGDPATRLPVAERMAEEGGAPLVVSAAGGEVNAPARELCHSPGDLTVLCVVPDSPQDTRAEARRVGELVAARGWTRVTVVTSTYHVERARLLLERCTDADVEVVSVRPLVSLVTWAAAIAHETVALGKALTDSSC